MVLDRSALPTNARGGHSSHARNLSQLTAEYEAAVHTCAKCKHALGRQMLGSEQSRRAGPVVVREMTEQEREQTSRVAAERSAFGPDYLPSRGR